jgi:transcriptional regulator with GAF, ATPase, and Fis domain
MGVAPFPLAGSRFDVMNPKTNIASRYETLLLVNEAARNESTSEAVFQGMCRVLKRVLSYDRAGLSIYDPGQDNLRIAALYGAYENSFFHVGDLLDRKSSQNGWTFEHQSKTIRRDLPKELRFATERYTVEEGFRSLCSVPLVVRGNSIGVVTVVGRQRNQFSEAHAGVLQQMSNQIALAITSLTQRCPTHASTRLVCPRCIGAAGGRTTVLKHREDLSMWGKKGGRGRKNFNGIESI